MRSKRHHVDNVGSIPLSEKMAESNFTCIPSILMDRGYGTMSVFVQTVTPKTGVEFNTGSSEFLEENSSLWLPLVSSAATVLFCFLVMLVLAFVVWFEKKRMAALRKDTLSVSAEYIMSTDLRFQEFQTKVSEKRQRFNRSMEKISATRKRVQETYTRLDNVKQRHDTVYEDMRYWKMTWINQTAKLRQINIGELEKLIKIQILTQEKLEKQKQYAQGFIAETEYRFGDIYHKLRCNKKAVDTIERDIDIFQTQLMGDSSFVTNRSS